MEEIVKEALANTVKQLFTKYPNSLFAREAILIRVFCELEGVIDRILTELVEQGLICNVDCSGEANQGAYCLAEQHGGTPQVLGDYLTRLRTFHHPPLPSSI